ncbi:hypothetical protein C5C57_05530 [Rathayibacter sp. AY1C5]|nr:hypothetical protein C5C57_05530 [Rathayibacter sp. AY1C5]
MYRLMPLMMSFGTVTLAFENVGFTNGCGFVPFFLIDAATAYGSIPLCRAQRASDDPGRALTACGRVPFSTASAYGVSGKISADSDDGWVTYFTARLMSPLAPTGATFRISRCVSIADARIRPFSVATDRAGSSLKTFCTARASMFTCMA